MLTKLEPKNKAIILRKKGYSYTNISKSTGIPKSTLSDWLKGVKLTELQMNKLKINSSKAHLLGGEVSRAKRLSISKEIRGKAIREISKIDRTGMLMLGAMLYWGEGSKQNNKNISQGVEFVNTDSKMCKFFVKWVTEILEVDIKDVLFRVYVNESKRANGKKYIDIWSKIMNISPLRVKICFTKDRYSNSKRLNRDNYKGQLKIVVKKSTNLNRRIAGLIEGICLQSGIAIE